MLSLSHLSILSSPFYLFSPFSLLHSVSLSFPFSLFSLPSPLTSLPSYPFALSVHSPPSSLPLLSSTISFLPSLTFFSSLSSPYPSLLSTFSVSHSVCSLPSVSPLYFLLSHNLSLLFSPFSTSLPFSSLFSPLILLLSTPFCFSHLHFLSSLLSLLSYLPSHTSPFLFSIPSPLHSLSTHSFSLHSLLCLIFIIFLLPFSPL